MQMPVSKINNPMKPKQEREGFGSAAWMNDATYLDYYQRLKSLALTMFEWEGLPESMDARFLELALYEKGKAVFCEDPVLGWLSVKCTPSDNLNIYGYATKYEAYAFGYNELFAADDVVFVMNNLLKIPTDYTIRLFAYRLYNIQRTIDINVNGQKTPIIVRTPEKTRLTMQNLYMQYDGNIPFIFGDKDLDINALEVLTTNAPYVGDVLTQLKKDVWSEALTFLGVNNVAAEKGERLIRDEVNANNQMVQLSAQVMLQTRQQAAEELAKRLGSSVSVRLRSFTELPLAPNFEDTPSVPETSGGVENG